MLNANMSKKKYKSPDLGALCWVFTWTLSKPDFPVGMRRRFPQPDPERGRRSSESRPSHSLCSSPTCRKETIRTNKPKMKLTPL